MTEKDLKAKVVKLLKKEYPHVFFWKTSDRFTSGIPDLILCASGRFVAIELKAKGKKPTKIQQFVLDKIKEAGGYSAVCSTVDEVRLFLNCFECL